MKPTPKKLRRIRDELIYDTIVEMAAASPDKAIKPDNVARALREDEWQGLLKRIKLFAGKLAVEGYVQILRKGKPADPEDFKGVYRIASAEYTPSYVPRSPQE